MGRCAFLRIVQLSSRNGPSIETQYPDPPSYHAMWYISHVDCSCFLLSKTECHPVVSVSSTQVSSVHPSVRMCSALRPPNSARSVV